MEHTEKTIRISDLVAAVVRGGQFVLILTVIFAMLLGAYGAVWYYVLAENPDEAYDVALEDYKLQKLTLETSVERTEVELRNQQEYNDKSLRMKIDPYNKHTTTATFAITNIDLTKVEDSFSALETPVSYIISRIQAQYEALWSSLNLEEIVAGTEYEGNADKYLREVIHFGSTDGGLFTLSVEGSSAQVCEKIADKIYAYMLKNKTAVETSSYAHDFAVLNDNVTKVSIDLELEKFQMDSQEQLDKYQLFIVECQKELLELFPPAYDGGMKGILGKTIAGAAIGLVLACAWLVCKQLLAGRITGTAHMTADYGLTYLGAAAGKKSFWTKPAAKIVGERVWDKPETALSYIAQNAAARLPQSGTIVVVSTLAQEDGLQRISQALTTPENKVYCVTDIAHDPKALALVGQSSGVVLAEQAFASKVADVEVAIQLVKELNKPIYGFVML